MKTKKGGHNSTTSRGIYFLPNVGNCPTSKLFCTPSKSNPPIAQIVPQIVPVQQITMPTENVSTVTITN